MPQKFRVKISDSAERDFERIAKYLIDNDFDIEILISIRQEAIRKLSEHPDRNAIFRDNVRKVQILRKNVVYYEIISDSVRILHVRAGGMNIDLD